MADDRASTAKIDVIGDSTTREILATLNVESFSVKELAEELDLSQPTVYRRLEQLEEHDLVTKRSIISSDGNHYNLYDCNFKSVVITLQNDEYDIWLCRKDSVVEKFAELWDLIRRAKTE